MNGVVVHKTAAIGATYYPKTDAEFLKEERKQVAMRKAAAKRAAADAEILRLRALLRSDQVAEYAKGKIRKEIARLERRL